jgi:endo-1,4-beta-xylanase
MVVHGHTLVWHQCRPSWIPADATREEAIGFLRDYIHTVVGRYQGRVPIWDVVNEAVADGGAGLRDTPWLQWIGEDYIELAFQFAHEADPDARLFYNDYGADGMNAKSDAIYALVSDLLARGVPIHGVGLQGHINLGSTGPGGQNTPELLGANIQRFCELGLEVQITELDVSYAQPASDEVFQSMAGDYRNVIGTCLESEYCTAVVVWGVADPLSWLRSREDTVNPNMEPLLFDANYQPKLAYTAVADLLARAAGEEPLLTDEEVAALMPEEIGPVEIPEPTFSDPAQLAPDSVPGVLYYAPFPVAITLDGELDDWAGVPRVTVDSGPLLPPNHDTAMTFAVAADDTYLYFLGVVAASSVVYGNHTPWSSCSREDGVEFYLNTTGNLAAPTYRDGIVQIGMMAANIDNPDPADPIMGGSNIADAQPTIVAVRTEQGYRIEASVPLTTEVWSITPEQDGVLGFQAHLNGASVDDRDTKLIWSIYDVQDQSYTNPSLFGQLMFWQVAP